MLGLTAVGTLALGVVAFINSSWFDVDEVTVVGNNRAEAAAIIDASGIRPGQGLLELDLAGAGRSVELVPWVGTAVVTRAWNGSVLIEVAERGPSAAIPAGGRFALVDDHGRQLEIVDQRPDGYVPIRGVEGSGVPGEPAPGELLPVIALLDSLPPELVDRVEAVVLDGQSLSLALVGGGEADFGEGVDLPAKLQAFETILARVDLQCLAVIDVRVPAAPVVTRTPESGPGAGAGADGGAMSETPDADQEPDSQSPDC